MLKGIDDKETEFEKQKDIVELMKESDKNMDVENDNNQESQRNLNDLPAREEEKMQTKEMNIATESDAFEDIKDKDDASPCNVLPKITSRKSKLELDEINATKMTKKENLIDEIIKEKQLNNEQTAKQQTNNMIDHIPCLYLPNDEGSNKLIIYFHGNAEDIGLAFDMLFLLG